MGTRGLTKVIDADGVLKVAQYGQWDHYPSGQGLNVLSIISKYGMLGRIKDNLSKCVSGTVEQIERMAYEAMNTNAELITLEQGNMLERMYPQLSRNTCSDILNVIAYSMGNEIVLHLDTDFENDELFCEGVFTVNFQTNEFISNCGVEVRFPLDNLPTEEVYLNAFRQEAVA